MNEYTATVIAESLEKHKNSTNENSKGKNLVSLFLDKVENFGKKEDLRDLILNFIIAGRDTTGFFSLSILLKMIQEQSR